MNWLDTSCLIGQAKSKREENFTALLPCINEEFIIIAATASTNSTESCVNSIRISMSMISTIDKMLYFALQWICIPYTSVETLVCVLVCGKHNSYSHVIFQLLDDFITVWKASKYTVKCPCQNQFSLRQKKAEHWKELANTSICTLIENSHVFFTACIFRYATKLILAILLLYHCQQRFVIYDINFGFPSHIHYSKMIWLIKWMISKNILC